VTVAIVAMVVGSASAVGGVLVRREWLRRRRDGDARSALVAIAAREGGAAGGTGDDLKVIEGIGPRLEGVLVAAGIDSYARLAEAGPSELKKLMRRSGKRAAKTDTWPEQARLAAEGRWDDLRALQGRLKGGVRRR
jgi:large subunit ribosomal protein L21